MDITGAPSSCAVASKVWRSRWHLPHYDEPGLLQCITFRLHDSLPAAKLAELNRVQRGLSAVQIRNRLEEYLDNSAGACYMRNPQVASLVQNTLLHFDGERYTLYAWAVMPNHVHVLAHFNSGFPVAKVLQSWKGYTARQANLILGRNGSFWQREYFDRYIRNDNHFQNAVKYIEWNPVQARLAKAPQDWPYSSASYAAREFD